MTRTRKWIAGFAALVVVAAIAIYFFDWNLARPYIARKIAHATGRTFAINGDLDVRLSLTPRIVANDVVLGNAEWSREPNMAEVKRIELTLELLPLLWGRVSIPDVALSSPQVILEVNDDGTPNWQFNKKDEGESTRAPDVGALAVDHGNLTYRDPRSKSDLKLVVNTLDGPQGQSVEVKGKGLFKGLPSTMTALGGGLLSLRSAAQPYPIHIQAVLGTTKATADGVLIDPLHMKGENVDFTLEGSDLALLYPIVGVPIPPTPPYKIAGRLNHTGDVWALRQFKGIVGKSDLSGDFSVDTSSKPQFIKADLVSNRLDMADLGGFIGADRGDKRADKPPPADKVLPSEPFSIEKLRAANADVKFRGAKVLTQKVPIEKMDAHMIVKDGNLELAPLNFSVAGGSLESHIKMSGSSASITSHAEISAKGLRIDQLMSTSKLGALSSGTMGGRAKLEMKGNSIAQMLGSANGEAAVIMGGGTVSELTLRLSNLDIANSLARMFGGDRQTPIRCFVSNWNAVNGDFQIQAMVLDTPKVNLHGTGDVNLKTEAINLRLTAHSKTFSLASLRGPIGITGTLKQPIVHPELGGVIVRGGLAAAVGTFTAGIGALIPLLELGKPEPSHCSELAAEAKADVGVKSSDIAPRDARKR